MRQRKGAETLERNTGLSENHLKIPLELKDYSMSNEGLQIQLNSNCFSVCLECTLIIPPSPLGVRIESQWNAYFTNLRNIKVAMLQT